jgi:hypothetical protein
MKRLTTIACFLLLLSGLAACTPAETAQPDDNLVSTQVAIILTETALAEPIETELPPTETVVPSPTTTEPAIEPTPTETPTASATPTPTEDQNDPALLLGAPSWTYDFSANSSPWDFDSDQASFNTNNGKLNITAKANANWHSWYVSSPRLKNAYVEAVIEMTNCAGADRFGLAVRSISYWHRFYFMGVTCEGKWGFFRMEPDVNIQQIVGFKSAEPATFGPNQPHRIGIWMKDTNFTFYIDGQEVGSASDSKITGDGYTGFLVAFANTPGFTVHVDDLRYWGVP